MRYVLLFAPCVLPVKLRTDLFLAFAYKAFFRFTSYPNSHPSQGFLVSFVLFFAACVPVYTAHGLLFSFTPSHKRFFYEVVVILVQNCRFCAQAVARIVAAPAAVFIAHVCLLSVVAVVMVVCCCY